MLVFRLAFERWVGEPVERPLAEVLDECFDHLRLLTVADHGTTSSGV